jgi:hypothetical protein
LTVAEHPIPAFVYPFIVARKHRDTMPRKEDDKKDKKKKSKAVNEDAEAVKDKVKKGSKKDKSAPTPASKSAANGANGANGANAGSPVVRLRGLGGREGGAAQGAGQGNIPGAAVERKRLQEDGR